MLTDRHGCQADTVSVCRAPVWIDRHGVRATTESVWSDTLYRQTRCPGDYRVCLVGHAKQTDTVSDFRVGLSGRDPEQTDTVSRDTVSVCFGHVHRETRCPADTVSLCVGHVHRQTRCPNPDVRPALTWYKLQAAGKLVCLLMARYRDVVGLSVLETLAYRPDRHGYRPATVSVPGANPTRQTWFPRQPCLSVLRVLTDRPARKPATRSVCQQPLDRQTWLPSGNQVCLVEHGNTRQTWFPILLQVCLVPTKNRQTWLPWKPGLSVRSALGQPDLVTDPACASSPNLSQVLILCTHKHCSLITST